MGASFRFRLSGEKLNRNRLDAPAFSSAFRHGAGLGCPSTITSAEARATGLRAGGFFSSLDGVAMDQKPTNGRPAGEVRRALLLAAIDLNMGDRAATLRELARKACVGQKAARVAVSNMRRSGALVIVRDRHESYRTRPVAEYAPGAMACTQTPSSNPFQALASAWAPSTI
jgi:hypothetical protein